ncbi:MAG: RNA polymerase sigma-70 factor (ECF subfamily) [Lentisphaeria bacterium]|jgi:RNA polymerase sigma-70 factor (ECF subfamily)
MIDRETLQKLYQYSYSLTKNNTTAEDLLQTSLEKFIKRSIQVKSESAYLRTMIRNQFIDDCRRKKVVSFDSIEDHATSLLDETSLESIVIDNKLVEQIFNSLNAGERETLYLWAIMGFSASEIAEETQQSRNTVLSRLHRLKQKVNDNFPEQTITDDSLSKKKQGSI